MQANLEKLIELQKVDSQLDEIRMIRGDLPQKVQSLKEENETLAAAVEDDEKKIAELETASREAQGEINLTKEKLKKYQDQLYKTTTNKEYEAVSAQIEFCEGEIVRLEQSIEDMHEEKVVCAEEMEEKTKNLELLKTELAEKETELKEKMQTTHDEEKELNKQREKIFPQIKKHILSRYDRIRNGSEGLAVVHVLRNACGGCFSMISSQRMMDLRKKDNIHYCEHCGRILYFDQEMNEAL